jgi:hypothetical protein
MIVHIRKYKYISFKQVDDEQFNGKDCYRIYNNKSDEQLGIVYYETIWKEYVFTSRDGCIFNNTCLRDVIHFMEEELPLDAVKQRPKK